MDEPGSTVDWFLQFERMDVEVQNGLEQRAQRRQQQPRRR